MVKIIVQKIVFSNIKASKLYDMYLDSKQHSAITGEPATIKAKEGSKYSGYDGYHYGKILQLIKDKLIVQSFTAIDWNKKDVDSTLILLFEQDGKDAIIYMTHANVPDIQESAINTGWKEFYWNPWKMYLKTLKK